MHQEATIIINIHTQQQSQKNKIYEKLKGEIDSSTTIIADFNTPEEKGAKRMLKEIVTEKVNNEQNIWTGDQHGKGKLKQHCEPVRPHRYLYNTLPNTSRWSILPEYTWDVYTILLGIPYIRQQGVYHSPGHITYQATKQISVSLKRLKTYKVSSTTTMEQSQNSIKEEKWKNSICGN